MRVLHIYKTYAPDSYGGVEQVIEQLTCATQKLGTESRLLTVSANTPGGMVGQLPVVRAPLHLDYASCPMSFGFNAYFREQAAWADILHYHFPWPFAEFFHILKKPKKPMIVTYHADITKQRFLKRCYQPVFRRFMNHASKIVIASPNYQASSVDLKPFIEKTVVIPFGFSFPIVSSVENMPILPEKFLLFVGVLRYYKGLSILLDALVGTDISVVIIGDGPERERLQLQVERLHLQKQVYFLGAVSEAVKWQVMMKTEVVILPSQLRAEAFGMALLEGLMFGKALISTELGSGTSFVNQHGQTGLVVPPNDPEALRLAMLRLWQDSALTTRYGLAARQRYLDYFVDDKMGQAYHRLYSTLLSP